MCKGHMTLKLSFWGVRGEGRSYSHAMNMVYHYESCKALVEGRRIFSVLLKLGLSIFDLGWALVVVGIPILLVFHFMYTSFPNTIPIMVVLAWSVTLSSSCMRIPLICLLLFWNFYGEVQYLKIANLV